MIEVGGTILKNIENNLDVPNTVMRKATFSDVDFLALAHVQAWQETYNGLLPPELINSLDFQRRKQMWSRILKEPNQNTSTFLCTFETGELLGFSSGSKNLDSPDQADLTCLYVLKKYQNHGVGKRLFQNTVNEMLKLKCTTLSVNVLTNNPYLTFYIKLGGSFCGSQQADFMGHNILESSFRFSLI